MAATTTSTNEKTMANRLSEDEIAAFEKVFKLSLEYMEKNYDREEPIVRFKTPKELEKEIAIPIGEEGVGFDAILPELENTLKFSVRTGHVRFFNQLWAGTDKAAVLGEWLTALTNTSMYTYEVSPVYTLMEIYLLDKIRKLVGWESGDGVFAPGGANCNLLGLLAARNHTIPHIKKEGVRAGEQFVLFTSTHSHYTVKRAASVMGIGMNNCIKVAVDKDGKLDPVALDEAITEAKAAGKTPIGISCTAGTTVLGAYDDIEAIADVAEKHGVWLHVDACWGGHCLLSAKHSHLMKGCHRADSIAWTATKCLGLPQQCSVLILKKRNVLYNCNAMNEDYLFHDHEEKDFDLGDRTLNCGRRVDALKLWLSWKVYGDKGFAQRVEHAFEQAQSLVQMIKERGDRFQLLTEPESLNVCFWYVPKAARSLPEGKEKYELMDKATLTIRRKMQLEGKVLVNYSDLSGVHGHFFRMITCNPFAGVEDIAFMLDEMERLGEL